MKHHTMKMYEAVEKMRKAPSPVATLNMAANRKIPAMKQALVIPVTIPFELRWLYQTR